MLLKAYIYIYHFQNVPETEEFFFMEGGEGFKQVKDFHEKTRSDSV